MKTRQAILVFIHVLIVCLAWRHPAWANDCTDRSQCPEEWNPDRTPNIQGSWEHNSWYHSVGLPINLSTPFYLSKGILVEMQPAAAAPHDLVTVMGTNNSYLSENDSVGMQKADVNVHVSKYLIKVDCCCTLINSGPACKITVGYPDDGDWLHPDHDAPLLLNSNKKYPDSAFLSFESYVDDEKAKTKTVARTVHGHTVPHCTIISCWHNHEIEFAANETKTVHYSYTRFPAFSFFSCGGFNEVLVSSLFYQNWHVMKGKEVKIAVTFDEDVLPKPLRGVSWWSDGLRSFFDRSKGRFFGELQTRGTFIYEADKAPQISGQTVRWDLLDPGTDHGVNLYFGYIDPKNEEQYEQIFRRSWQQKQVPQ